MDWRIFFAIFAFTSIGISSAVYTSEKDAKQFLYDTSNRLIKLYNEISDETFDIDDKLFSAALVENGMTNKIAVHMLDIVKEAKRYNVTYFADPEVIKAIRKLRSADLFVLDEDFHRSLSSSLLALQETATDSDLCNYIKHSECDMAYLPDVRKIYSNSVNPLELQYYWEEWRLKQLSYGNYHFLNVVELFRRAADQNSVSVSEFWFRTYEDPDFLKDMESVMQQLKPFYQEFHAYIRRELSTKYGRNIVNQVGPIPDHLIEQILQQAWKKQSVLSHSFPKNRLPNLQEGLKTQGFDISKIMDSAEEFYISLGFDVVPEYLRENRFKENNVTAGKDCKPDIYDTTSKIYMKWCRSASFKKFLQVHGYLARIHYGIEKSNIPFYFFPSYNLEYPLGESVILSASTPIHMDRADILNNFNYTSEVAMNRLFRMGVHTMFNIPMHFVNTKVMVDVLEGRVPLERTNQYYWKLMDEYAGIEPPVDRRMKFLDFSYKFFEDLGQNHQTRKFVSEIMGYQMYESFCLLSGGYVPGDPNKPLHACDFYGNKDVGAVMKKMMQMGSKKSWRETVRAAVGIPAMSASSLLEYYKPLYEWLKEQNRVSGTKIGWTASTKVVL